jgi:hypothetical protein
MNRSDIRAKHAYRTKRGYVLRVDDRNYRDVTYHCESGPDTSVCNMGGRIPVDEFLERVVAEVPEERLPC